MAPQPRILDISSGLTMVVSDLHGDKDAFARHTGRFLQYRSRGRVQRLVLLGDLIHSDGPDAEDASLQMIFDVMRMQASLGKDAVVMLLGNHEFSHIYSMMLRRGNFEYTPRFEKALSASGRRAEVMAFFDSLPFYIRSAAGVTLTHAGPDGSALSMFKQLAFYDHQAILDEFTNVLNIYPHRDKLRDLYASTIGIGMPYEILARYCIAVEGADDPRYDDLIRSFMIQQKSTEFSALHDALFTRCEKNMTMAFYERLLKRFLETLSEGAPATQKLLVTGHIDVQGGHAVVTQQHLRIASAKHAFPREAGQYLLFDPSKPVENADGLVPQLGSVYG